MRNSETMTDVELDARFAELQRDLFNPDASVLWCGATVILYVREDNRVKRELAHITGDEHAIRKIKLWCVKNSYRCPQCRDGKIYL